ncbi:MAG TPA: chromate efflux transporter [Acidimicrobiales bacterium]|nr:chromate efflux transporter [Acidimicrobiales bacterium]
MMEDAPSPRVPLLTIAREWTRMGCIGFGGPPTHITLLRRLCVEQRKWMDEREFEDGVAATSLLPGPASTQLAIYCAWRLRGTVGAIIGGLCFIVPGLILILALSVLFLERHAPEWVLGAAAGAGAAVPAVALKAAWTLAPASRRAAANRRAARARWISYVLVGGAVAASAGEYLVLALIACGLLEIAARGRERRVRLGSARVALPGVLGHIRGVGGVGAIGWVALKVGALSYGGGFVIVPLMQHDVVDTYHWMSGTQFLSAVALGQLTPGPVVQTVAVVGYAAGGIGGGLLAALIVFTPSFLFVFAGAPHFDQVRENVSVQSFFRGAGPAVIGAIAGSAIPLGRSLVHVWQIPVLAGALVLLFVLRRSVVTCLLLAGLVGLLLGLSGVSV